MTAQYPITGGFPNVGALIIDKNGKLTDAGYYLLKLMWDRLGGNSGQFIPASILSGSAPFADSGASADQDEPFIIPGPAGPPGIPGIAGQALALEMPDVDEPMMVPALTSPGGWFDEKGSGGAIGFVAGVDFTAGTSTSLTLSQPYGSQANLIVAFDTSFKGGDLFTLSGKTLTFNSAIPNGTSKVYVKGFLMPR